MNPTTPKGRCERRQAARQRYAEAARPVTDPCHTGRSGLTAEGRPVLHGWWDDEPTARRKFRSLIGEQGRDGVTITLVDEDTGEQLDSWPRPVVSGGSYS